MRRVKSKYGNMTDLSKKWHFRRSVNDRRETGSGPLQRRLPTAGRPRRASPLRSANRPVRRSFAAKVPARRSASVAVRRGLRSVRPTRVQSPSAQMPTAPRYRSDSANVSRSARSSARTREFLRRRCRRAAHISADTVEPSPSSRLPRQLVPPLDQCRVVGGNIFSARHPAGHRRRRPGDPQAAEHFVRHQFAEGARRGEGICRRRASARESHATRSPRVSDRGKSTTPSRPPRKAAAARRCR